MGHNTPTANDQCYYGTCWPRPRVAGYQDVVLVKSIQWFSSSRTTLLANGKAALRPRSAPEFASHRGLDTMEMVESPLRVATKLRAREP